MEQHTCQSKNALNHKGLAGKAHCFASIYVADFGDDIAYKPRPETQAYLINHVTAFAKNGALR